MEIMPLHILITHETLMCFIYRVMVYNATFYGLHVENRNKWFIILSHTCLLYYLILVYYIISYLYFCMRIHIITISLNLFNLSTGSVLFFSIYSRTLSFVRIARSNYMYLVRSLHMLAIFIPVNVNIRLLQNNVIGLFDFYKYIL